MEDRFFCEVDRTRLRVVSTWPNWNGAMRDEIANLTFPVFWAYSDVRPNTGMRPALIMEERAQYGWLLWVPSRRRIEKALGLQGRAAEDVAVHLINWALRDGRDKSFGFLTVEDLFA